MIEWDEISEHINYIAMDANQDQIGYGHRPECNAIFSAWFENALHHFDPPLFDIDTPWQASLHQRPGTWDGILRRYDNVLLADGHHGYLDLCNAPKKKTRRRIGLPVEVHNEEPVDIDRAMAAIHALCRGHNL